MSSSQLRRLFGRRDRGYAEAEGYLTRLYRTILRDVGYTFEDQVQAIERWLSDPEGGNITSRRERSEARSNYIRMITRPRMTVRTFYILIKMWYPESMTMTVKIRWRSPLLGTTEHFVTTNFRPPAEGTDLPPGHLFKLSDLDEDSEDIEDPPEENTP